MMPASLGAARHDVDDQRQQRRIGLPSSEKSWMPAGRPDMKLVEAQQRLVGARALAEDAQQRRRQLRQPLARLDRVGGAVAAVMPGADDAGNVARARWKPSFSASPACPDRRRGR